MSRYPQDRGEKGSLKWIQAFVNERPRELDDAMRAASRGGIQTPIEWLSPLETDDYAEYRDGAFLEKLDISLEKPSLSDFWPRRGPQWDALAVDATGARLPPPRAQRHRLVARVRLLRRSLGSGRSDVGARVEGRAQGPARRARTGRASAPEPGGGCVPGGRPVRLRAAIQFDLAGHHDPLS